MYERNAVHPTGKIKQRLSGVSFCLVWFFFLFGSFGFVFFSCVILRALFPGERGFWFGERGGGEAKNG